MIVPMLKYSFLVYHQDHEEFLQQLRDIGVVHIMEKRAEFSEETKKAFQKIDNLKDTIKLLERREVEQKEQKYDRDVDELMEEIQNTREEIDRLYQRINTIHKTIVQQKPWGDFSPAYIQYLRENNIYVHFFMCPAGQFDEKWKEDYYLEVIQECPSDVYFIIVTRDSEQVNIEAEELEVPKESISQLQADKKAYEQHIDELQQAMDEYAAHYQDLLSNGILDIQENTQFNEALHNTEKQAEDKVMLTEGWVPQPKEQALLDFLKNRSVVYVKEKAENENPRKVPVLLKNDKFTRIFEPIGNLFSLPHYKEIDLTPFFAPFFMLFFGFCLGDAGYGVLFVIASSIAKPRVKPNLKPIMTMVQFFGGATIVFGLLTGILFGVELHQLDLFSQYKESFISMQEMFNLALAVGVLQILFGMALNVANQIRQRGFVYGVSTLGWIILIVSSLVYFMAFPESLQATLQPVYYGFIILSGIMIIFYSNPQAGILSNLGSGLWNVYDNITGLFGDFLSYIRLFAIGLSTAVLGIVFNSMATSLSPDIPVLGEIAFLLILLIGHSINIFMSSISSLVHPMRLIFVEFFNNAGFNGGGKPYKPFAKVK